jgi:hypothetical protein
MSRNQRIALLALAVVVLVGAFVIAQSGSNDSGGGGTTDATSTPAANPAVETVVVQNAKPVGGVQVLKFKKGGTIRFKVRSDVADEVHFHGYDKHAEVKKGGVVAFNVPATIDGKFVVELEGLKEQIASVEVQP